MKRLSLCLLALSWIAGAQARPLYSDGFDPPHIEPQFPVVGGEYQLPPGPTANQLQWFMSELAAGETTTIEEINAHFDPTWLAQTPAPQTQAFMQSIRDSYPNARIMDLVSLTPVRATVVIDSPGSPPPHGYVSFGTRYTGAQRITLLGVSGYGGTVMYPEDRTLTFAQAADKFVTLSSAPSLLVARINRNTGQCTEIVGRNPDQARATASIFKIWALGGVGRSIALNQLASSEMIPMVASELAPGGIINGEPLNTPFPVRDLATLMIGNSDNTATDLLHERVGRTLLEQIAIDYGVAQPALLTPFLGISEQFHVFRSFPLDQALSYVNGTEPFQVQFLNDHIIPLGPLTSTPYFHTQLLTSGTWQASPFDICRAFAALRRLPQGSEALQVVDAALAATVVQPDVRSKWDRVWYKGGSLAAAAGDYHVLTHAWMLENAGEDPFVVAALSNSNTGGINLYFVQSVTGRLLELASLMP